MSTPVLIPKNKMKQDVVSPTLSYVGYAPAGAATSDSVWEIMRVTSDGSANVIAQDWAEASGNYTHKWDDRAILVYS